MRPCDTPRRRKVSADHNFMSALRSFTGMSLNWNDITHVTKADPAKELPRDLGILAGTDAVMVGGSDGVTAENTLDTIRAIRGSFPDKLARQT